MCGSDAFCVLVMYCGIVCVVIMYSVCGSDVKCVCVCV